MGRNVTIIGEGLIVVIIDGEYQQRRKRRGWEAAADATRSVSISEDDASRDDDD